MDRETLYVVSRPVSGSAMYVFRTRAPAREYAAKKNSKMTVPKKYQYTVSRAKWGPDNTNHKEIAP